MDKNGKHNTKISGYLEKKGKNKMISSYKKYWFVLEGGLLLYYRSKDDYESISPCKGSINLGPPCIIKPCSSSVGVFQIQTRTATITLRAENLEEQNRWMEAIMFEIQPNKNPEKMSHFRYSMVNLPLSKEQNRNNATDSECSQNSQEDIIKKLQKMGAQSYGNPLYTISKNTGQMALPNLTTDEEFLRKVTTKEPEYFDHIYERISTDIRDSPNRENNDEESKTAQIRAATIPLESFNTLKLKQAENRPKTYIVENETYAIRIEEKEKTEDTNYRKFKKEKKLKPVKCDNFVIENDTYASVEKSTETISRDLNENDVSKITGTEEENAYSIPYIKDGVYEVIDNVEYAEPCEYKVPEKTKRKKNKKNADKSKESTDDNKQATKVKKRSSFISLVWKKKEKQKEKIEDTKDDDKECIYETVPEEVVEKVGLTDTSAIRMLSELQNVLEHKMPMLIEKISNEMNSPTNKTPIDILPEPIRKILENKETNKLEKSLDPPPLAPKTRRQEFSSPFHDVPTNNKPIPLPPRRKKINNYKNLDDILDELTSQQLETKKNKVKKLIKKFSGQNLFENDVVLRNRKEGIYREEDELSRLLADLAKVTNAPMLIPGVTSSLNGNNIKDEELSKLLPVKQRRYSEPDYDIPRPHKALTISQKKDDVSTNVIESTRFFGPILKPSGVIVSEHREILEIPSQLNSITPDSLESNINQIPSTNKHPHKFIDKKSLPKTSIKSTNDYMVDNDIYAEPRSIQAYQLSNEDYDLDDEVFVDSLEICKNEVSTEF